MELLGEIILGWLQPKPTGPQRYQGDNVLGQWEGPDKKLPCKHSVDQLLRHQFGETPCRFKRGSCHYAHLDDEDESLGLKLMAALCQAKRTLDIWMFIVTYKPFVDILISLNRRGVKIRIITDGSTKINNKDHVESMARLEALGFQIKFPPNSLMHKKTVIVDSEMIIDGSLNWTKGIVKNFESIRIRKDNLGKTVQDFEKDWRQYNLEKNHFRNLKIKLDNEIARANNNQNENQYLQQQQQQRAQNNRADVNQCVIS